ncbi:hypothetical protein LH51_08330 [Nitrincola sp. A-D6]|nr:hypothetical protein LH51_08330 [Nitrincola sp. A-D6]
MRNNKKPGFGESRAQKKFTNSDNLHNSTIPASIPTLGEIMSTRESAIAHLFPVKAKKCAECKKPLNKRTRRRVVIFRTVNGHPCLSAFQLCKKCRAQAEADSSKTPVILRDMAAADYIFTNDSVDGVH